MKAVYYHNKKEVTDGLTEREKEFCYMIRDVDKIDIYHVLANDFNKEFNFMPSEKVLNNFYNKELIDIEDLQNPSDSILLYLAFQDQLVFKESYEILYQKGYFEEFIKSIRLDHNQLILDTFDHIVDEAYNHRDDNLYNKKLIKVR